MPRHPRRGWARQRALGTSRHRRLDGTPRSACKTSVSIEIGLPCLVVLRYVRRPLLSRMISEPAETDVYAVSSSGSVLNRRMSHSPQAAAIS
jgi:hypothetical protein